MRLALVLDTSAIAEYAGGSLRAGELLDVLREDGNLFGVPDVCIAQARAHGAPMDGLTLLQAHEQCQVLTAPAPALLGDVARLCRGDLVRATVLIHAISNDAYIVTTDPDYYTELSIVDEADIIHLLEDWPR
jgi:hypothetical protein